MVLFHLDQLLSDQEEGKKRPKRRNRRNRSNGKKTPSGVKPEGDKEAVERALSRFTIDPPPMGFTPVSYTHLTLPTILRV